MKTEIGRLGKQWLDRKSSTMAGQEFLLKVVGSYKKILCDAFAQARQKSTLQLFDDGISITWPDFHPVDSTQVIWNRREHIKSITTSWSHCWIRCCRTMQVQAHVFRKMLLIEYVSQQLLVARPHRDCVMSNLWILTSCPKIKNK